MTSELSSVPISRLDERFIPSELIFNDKAVESIYTQQTLQLVPPQSGNSAFSSVNGSNICVFSLGNQGFLDGKQSYFSFKAKCVEDTPTTDLQFRNGIGSIVDYIHVRVENQLIEELNYYNIYQRIKILTELDDAAMNANWSSGTGTNAALQASATDYRYYILKPLSGLFLQWKLIPLLIMNVDMQLIVRFNSTQDALIYTSGSAHYEVSELNLSIETHNLDQKYTEKLINYVEKGGEVSLLFPSWYCYTANYASSSAQIKVEARNRSVKAIIIGMRNQSNLNNVAQDVIFTDSALNQFQLRMGTDIYPQDPLKAGSPSMLELMKAVGQDFYFNKSNQITYQNYVANPTNFLLGIDLEQFMNPDIKSGMDWTKVPSVLLNLQSNSVPDSLVYMFVIFDIELRLGKNKLRLID